MLCKNIKCWKIDNNHIHVNYIYKLALDSTPCFNHEYHTTLFSELGPKGVRVNSIK